MSAETSHRTLHAPVRIAAADARLIERLHGGFPLDERPFAALGTELGMDEAEVIARLRALLDAGVLTRFGPLFHIERGGGQFVLAALAVPDERFDAVRALVNAHPEVAHNYRREHALNMWFVVAAETPARARQVLAAIEAQTDLPVLALPKEREFRVELRLPVAQVAGDAG